MTISPFRLSGLSATLLGLSVLPALAEPLTIDGSGLSRDVHCAGDDVEIYGANNTIKLTGTCTSVTVGGLEQSVEMEEAGKLDVSGSGHKITGTASALALYGDASTVTVTIDGAATEPAVVDVSGGEHKLDLTLRKAVRLDVQGISQQVTWALGNDASEPKVSISGADNKVERKP